MRWLAALFVLALATPVAGGGFDLRDWLGRCLAEADAETKRADAAGEAPGLHDAPGLHNAMCTLSALRICRFLPEPEPCARAWIGELDRRVDGIRAGLPDRIAGDGATAARLNRRLEGAQAGSVETLAEGWERVKDRELVTYGWLGPERARRFFTSHVQFLSLQQLHRQVEAWEAK